MTDKSDDDDDRFGTDGQYGTVTVTVQVYG